MSYTVTHKAQASQHWELPHGSITPSVVGRVSVARIVEETNGRTITARRRIVLDGKDGHLD